MQVDTVNIKHRTEMYVDIVAYIGIWVLVISFIFLTFNINDKKVIFIVYKFLQCSWKQKFGISHHF